MGPRPQTLRPAQTASAREAMRHFFCDLCQKGYSRMNEYESHLSSYDHSHKQRLKDMKAMVRDPGAAERARRQEAKATDAVISIKLGDGHADGGGGGSGTATGGGFKKGGFKKGGFKSAFVPVDKNKAAEPTATEPAASTNVRASAGTEPVDKANSSAESDTDDEGYEMYDPRKPTD